ncbi:hypothetical protein AABB24_040267 [Solanum stoloniferum]|uniref:Uncharacterized protein n=1 Tax=Solanum stoloniferum TaxID=62892 RepID=A0ABD2QX09_9SOLN
MELGQLNTLEALDLSWNRLTRMIPQELTRMNFLAILNLSENHLVGPIPHGLQFNTFENDPYGGNLDLCGPPLSKQCGTSDSSHVPQPLESEEDESVSYFFSGFTWESVVIGYSFGVVVGTVMWSLMYVTKYKTKDALVKNRLAHIPRDQWNGLVSYWLSEKSKNRSQTNRISRANQKMAHTGGSKSIATLMNERAIDGIEPTRAKIYILTHTERRDGRPLDEESSNAVDMMKEKLSNGEIEEQSHDSVAWEGDVYSQVLGKEKSGYVRGLGLGPTLSLLGGSKSFLQNVSVDGLCNEVAKKLEQEINELNKKQDEEMVLMRKNQEMLVSELSWMRKVTWKYAPTELAGLKTMEVLLDSEMFIQMVSLHKE